MACIKVVQKIKNFVFCTCKTTKYIINEPDPKMYFAKKRVAATQN